MENQELEDWLEQFELTHDTEAMRVDVENNNLEIGADGSYTDEYVFETIVLNSIANGQRKQAEEQCKRFGLEFSDFRN